MSSIVKQTNEIDLDFGEMTTDKVTLDSKSLSFTHKNGKLQVDFTRPGDSGNTFDI